ncbi:Uncharacterised protein [Serratia proteamaculans]|nr:Uncharacterised protein [Serratia proteamaculans]
MGNYTLIIMLIIFIFLYCLDIHFLTVQWPGTLSFVLPLIRMIISRIFILRSMRLNNYIFTI